MILETFDQGDDKDMTCGFVFTAIKPAVVKKGELQTLTIWLPSDGQNVKVQLTLRGKMQDCTEDPKLRLIVGWMTYT